MDRAADIEIGEMEKHLGHLGLIAGIAPTLGLLELYQSYQNILQHFSN
jgi:biopolymer transport protein ExbB/TolQ